MNPREVVRAILRFAPYRGKYLYHCDMLKYEDMAMVEIFEGNG
ncbi:hypothetical protein HJG54_25410 [Leptolyngbya sp. NK1-12]|uniref:Uncharacterized protein n=1 Tax=Leptolyngbya sp. NK1-12 TaxID=2547451 RepID=A0AA96WIB1_9CYAN|nr:hypothetical protein HJG54_25410 [Leptolyngbya sp. NK1-12]